MGGGLMQLVAYGAQDIYLTGNPQITFFKVVYRRHTNFSMESIQQTFNGSVGYGNRVTATISRNGDLVHRMYLEIDMGAGGHHDAGPNPGAAILSEVECEIGGQKIDKHYGHWMETWAELTEPNHNGHVGAHSQAVVGLLTNGTRFQNMSGMGGVVGQDTTVQSLNTVSVPLQFWFCRNPGLALPLIALQYHEVKIIITFAATTAVWHAVTAATLSSKLYADYIYLDTDERRRFAQVSHEYLIEQLQYQSSGDSLTHDLNFNHPVKELIWTGGTTAATTDGAVGPGGLIELDAGTTFTLKLNGHERFSARDREYFTRTQVWQHHTGFGGILLADANDGGASIGAADSIGVYSFALKPEEHQPSGTCNFSRIDNAQLILSVTDELDIYAVNYNVLRIMSGMGGLAYSN
jgi:hypothetical protein